jgi:hypothetical protein
MSGRLQPKPPFFMALGMFNQAVAERDFAGVTDRRLMDRLRAGQPICHEDGVPWNAMDFFGCYIGEVQAPTFLEEPEVIELTQEVVEEWAAKVRDEFRALCLSLMINPPNAWLEVKRELLSYEVALDEIEWAQEVVSGFREPTLDEAKRIMEKWENQPLIRALIAVKERGGGETTGLKKLQAWRERFARLSPGEGAKNLPWVQKRRERHFGFNPYGNGNRLNGCHTSPHGVCSKSRYAPTWHLTQFPTGETFQTSTGSSRLPTLNRKAVANSLPLTSIT